MVDRLGPVRTYREIRRDFDPLVLVLAAGDLVASFGFALVFPFLTIYLVGQFGASATEAGLVVGAYSVCSIFSGAAGGWLADRVGRRPVMIVSVGLTGIVVALMGRAPDLPTITALTMVLGLVDPAFVPAARAAIADVVPVEKRPRAYGLLNVAYAVGWIVGPAVGAGLATLGYSLLFTVSGAFIGAYAVIAFIWLRETLPAKRRSPHETRPMGATEEAIDPGIPLRPAGGGAADDPSFSRARVGAFMRFLPIAAVVHGVIFLWVTVLPIHVSRDFGVATGAWGLLFSLNGILIVVFQLRISSAVEGRSKAGIMAAAVLVYAIGMMVVSALATPLPVMPALAVAIVLFTIGEMLLFPTEPAFVSDLSPADRRGRYQGIFLAATGLGTALGPPVGGFVLDAAPGPPLWALAAGVFVVAGAALGALDRRTRSLPAADDG
jgi:MFS family permease